MKLSWLFFKKYILSKNANSITRKISFLCFLGIGISVLAMTVIVSVMNGFGQAIESRLLNFEPHLIIKSKKPSDPSSDLKSLSQKINSAHVNSYLFYEDQAILRTVDGQYGSALLKGLDGASLQHFIQSARQVAQSRVKKMSWTDMQESPLILGKDDIVIGTDLAYQLGIFIGDQVVITPPESLLLPAGEIPQTQKRTIQDVLRTGIQGIDSQVILYTKKETPLFQDSLSHQVLLEVYLDKISDIDSVLKIIPTDQFDVQTWRDRNAALFYSLKMEKGLITFFLFLALLIGTFSIVTILILLATQKRQEIAVLLTLGLKPSQLSRMFTHIGFLISAMGILGGFTLGLLICIFLDQTSWIELPDIYYDRTLPVQFVPQFYAFILILSISVSLLSSYLPAKWLLKFKPQDILRKNFQGS